MSYSVISQTGFVAGPEGLEPLMEVAPTTMEPSPVTHRVVFAVGTAGDVEPIYAAR